MLSSKITMYEKIIGGSREEKGIRELLTVDDGGSGIDSNWELLNS